MRSSLRQLEHNITVNRTDINIAALILAIVYPVEVTSSQALRAIVYNTKLPQEQEITPKVISKCVKYIKRNEGWNIDELAHKHRVNTYALYTEVRREFG